MKNMNSTLWNKERKVLIPSMTRSGSQDRMMSLLAIHMDITKSKSEIMYD